MRCVNNLVGELISISTADFGTLERILGKHATYVSMSNFGGNKSFNCLYIKDYAGNDLYFIWDSAFNELKQEDL